MPRSGANRTWKTKQPRELRTASQVKVKAKLKIAVKLKQADLRGGRLKGITRGWNEHAFRVQRIVALRSIDCIGERHQSTGNSLQMDSKTGNHFHWVQV